jgi:hypothetical protein
VGDGESSTSATNTCAPEFSALMIIFRSTGPVISTRRSCRSGGGSDTRQSASRTGRVFGRIVGRAPASNSHRRSRRASSSASIRAPNRSTGPATNRTAAGANRSAASAGTGWLN